ncbi:Npun_R2821/Npun_R2822 family protein [Mastigocoleus sp. MO_188.B34]|uniref:Npun_R2821/Npun_R2822 family protein n=1 Tax=Mastigocoleus sp. MO_188.B34 TaxID=3036635 RepID=UPI00262BE526|nr:Npun_R2821/Npun_R2822 family protein [Mastigocoleus sp. MO_188.B34]MDJ0697439.1 sugar transferase [Mastigocoleus sp. MO_188.B34]
MKEGIYTLANDVVYDQLVALLNSIETNAGRDIPVCIIPYDQQLDKVQKEIAARENVTLFEDTESIAYWENFATQAWKSHSTAEEIWSAKGISGIYRLPRYRKYCCFDGSFDKFIFFDADTLLMQPLDYVYQSLNQYDWVVNDFQYKSAISYIFDCPQDELLAIFSPEVIKSQIFCSGWFASHKGMFDSSQRELLLKHLNSGEANIMAWRDSDQTLLNYMVWRSGISFYNFAYHDLANTAGSHWSSKFDVMDNVLYDEGRRLTYLHYMSISSSKFSRLCAGEDVNIPYRDIFLHYRYLKSPESRPKTLTSPNPFVYSQRASKTFLSQKISNLKYRFRKFVAGREA